MNLSKRGNSLYLFTDYTSHIRQDLTAGLTTAIVALPLALAFGIASGAGPLAGLYSAILVGFFAAVFGGTRQQVSGPTGPMTVVLTAVIAQFSATYPEQWLSLAFTTVCLAGLLQILMGVLRLGKYIVMVPYPVISGFMTGIGLIIIILQIPVILGGPSIPSVPTIITALPSLVTAIDMHSLLLTGMCLLLLFIWRGRINQFIPASLAVLILMSLFVMLLPSNWQVSMIGEIPFGLPELIVPTINWQVAQTIIVNAFMLAVLGAIDSLLTSLVVDNETGQSHDSDQELIGQGIGNMVAGLFAALPGAGATMRSMVNIKAGAKGPTSGAFHALVLLAIALGLGGIFVYIPQVILAAILIKVGLEIIDWPFLRQLHKLPRFTVLLMLTVLCLTIFVDLISAVLVGVFIKNLDTVQRLSDLQLGSVSLSDGQNNTHRLTIDEIKFLQQQTEQTVLLKITGPISYAAGRGLQKKYQPYRQHAHLIVDLSCAQIVGSSTAMVINDLLKQAVKNGTNVSLRGIDEQSLVMFRQLGLFSFLPAEKIHTVHA